MSEKHLYSYNGPVTQFGKLVCNKWSGETMAVSEKKAKSQLIYRFKTQHGLLPNTKVEFPGKIILVS